MLGSLLASSRPPFLKPVTRERTSGAHFPCHLVTLVVPRALTSPAMRFAVYSRDMRRLKICDITRTFAGVGVKRPEFRPTPTYSRLYSLVQLGKTSRFFISLVRIAAYTHDKSSQQVRIAVTRAQRRLPSELYTFSIVNTPGCQLYQVCVCERGTH